LWCCFIDRHYPFLYIELNKWQKNTLTLYHYGKEAEKEIWETIQSSIV
jgi:outer membrane lipopolysaccharide assembly protein LptE/RlpB